MGLQRVGHDWETELNSNIWNFSALMSSHVSILVKWKVFDAILYLNVHVLLIITFCQTFFLNKYRVLPLLSSPLSWLQFRPHFSQWKLHFPLVSPNPLCPHLESNAAHSLNNPLLNDHFVPSTVLGTGGEIRYSLYFGKEKKQESKLISQDRTSARKHKPKICSKWWLRNPSSSHHVAPPSWNHLP